MFEILAKRFFGSANDRFLKPLYRRVEAINALEADLISLSDKDLQARTPWLRERLTNGETEDDILEEAFATVREAAKRTLGQRHFDVQLLGLVTVPKFIETNFVMYPTFVQLHYQSMIALIVLFVIHLSAGLYHRFINSDKYGVWNRMSFWGKD